ncbi:MAG TPA: hypothetical protein DCS66_19430 [Flavobacteriaceae bacterium]|nr:hypothetical protein [Flavobacteriaceae bacterium]
MADNKELLAQRDFMDELLASRLTALEHQKSMKMLDSIYFSDKLPKNVIPFPLNRIKRLNVDILTQQSSKKNI